MIAGIINFLVLVFLFRKLLGDKIVQEVEKRRTMLEKLKKADDEYKKMIEFARKESDLILEKAEKTKKGANTQPEGARIALLLYSGQCVCINT